MKPLHKLKYSDPVRPVFNFIQVKKGAVNVISPSGLVILPIKEVFGENTISDSEELYFEKRLWQLMKFDKAASITREENTFTAKDKRGLLIGTITALTEKQFVSSYAKYPDVSFVMPSPEKSLVAIEALSFNPSLLLEMCSVFAVEFHTYRFFFYGETKSIVIKSLNSKGIALLMPIIQENADFEWPKADLEIAELL